MIRNLSDPSGFLVYCLSVRLLLSQCDRIGSNNLFLVIRLSKNLTGRRYYWNFVAFHCRLQDQMPTGKRYRCIHRHMYMCVHKRANMHSFKHTYVNAHKLKYIYIYIYTHVHIYMYTYACINTCIHACTCKYMHPLKCAYTYACVLTYSSVQRKLED